MRKSERDRERRNKRKNKWEKKREKRYKEIEEMWENEGKKVKGRVEESPGSLPLTLD